MDSPIVQNFLRGLRSWDADFLGVGGKAPFEKPTSSDVAFARLKKNGEFFGMNYVVVLLVLTVLAVLLHPILVIVAIIYAIALAAIATRPPNWALNVAGYELRKKESWILASALFFVAAFSLAHMFILAFIAVAMFIIFGHAMFRVPLNDKMESAGDTGVAGAEAADESNRIV